MSEDKLRLSPKIYSLDHDKFVCSPQEEMRSLDSQRGWEWDDVYLCPHLKPASVSTAITVQVRSPINAKSLGGWRHDCDSEGGIRLDADPQTLSCKLRI